MKKYLKLLLCAALGIGAFTACEDVPAPYNIPTNGGDTPSADYILNQSFTSSLGDFTSKSESGNITWTSSAKYGAIISGYDDWDGSGTKSNKPGVTFLVSPEIELADCDSAYVFIDQAINYAKSTVKDDHHLLIRLAGTEAWAELPMSFTGLGSSFTYVSQNIQIPQEYIGKTVQLALKHIAHDSYSSTWEVKTLQVVKGQAPAGNSGEEPVNPAIEIDCAKAVELANALSDNGTSTEIYTVTGYITEVVGNPSNNQQTFWMADAKDGGRVFEAYYANLPAGLTAFTKGAKVKITGQLTKYVKSGNITAEIKNADVEILEEGGDDTPATGIEVSCAEAVTLTNALADGGTSSETYTITGYITEVVSDVSRNQQSFWMADAKDGGKVFEAYWANLPEGVSKFTVGMKVKITGNLMKYVKDGKVTPEIKNATVVILESGSGGGGDTPTGTEVTCAQAVELTNALENGATSSETYSVTGYITEVISDVSRNQQSFWMADTKDGGKVFEAYWANLPEGVSKFTVGTKVKITGNLMKYVNNSGQVTPEIKNATVEILEGGSEGGGEEPGTDVKTLADFANGDFETWADGQPTGWKSASTASNATLSQSTDAHGGSYSVKVGGASSNKRLAYEELVLEAGTYAVSFYAKAATDEGGSVNPGYVPMKSDGSVGSYVYGGYVNDLNTSEWVKVDYEFTLSEKTTICLVVMNSKNPGKDVLVDDYTITKK